MLSAGPLEGDDTTAFVVMQLSGSRAFFGLNEICWKRAARTPILNAGTPITRFPLPQLCLPSGSYTLIAPTVDEMKEWVLTLNPPLKGGGGNDDGNGGPAGKARKRGRGECPS